jgi:hypothetical protein
MEILKQETYNDFLTGKIKLAEKKGLTFEIDPILHESTKPHQKDITIWNLMRGSSLVAADCGMGKTHISIETVRVISNILRGKHLIVTELGVEKNLVTIYLFTLRN